MSTEPLGKKQYSSSEVSAIIINHLDAQDGNVDNKIGKKEWNIFADYVGLERTEDDYISVEDAAAGLDVVMLNNPAKIVNYSREYANKKITLHYDGPTDKKSETESKTQGQGNKNSELMLSSLMLAMSAANPIFGVVYGATQSKKVIDKATEVVIKESSIETVRKVIRASADTTASQLPVASELLDISATPEKLTVGKHKNYTVLNPEQSEKKLAQIGMHGKDTNRYGSPIDHFTSDKMELNTVLYNKDSNVSRILSGSKLVKAAIDVWEQDGCPKKKYYSGGMSDTSDELLAINSCLLTITDCKDNGKTKTYTGYIEDVYDFSETYNEDSTTLKSQAGDTINKAAYLAQEKGAITNYRVLIPFTRTVDK